MGVYTGNRLCCGYVASSCVDEGARRLIGSVVIFVRSVASWFVDEGAALIGSVVSLHIL